MSNLLHNGRQIFEDGDLRRQRRYVITATVHREKRMNASFTFKGRLRALPLLHAVVERYTDRYATRHGNIL